MSDTPALMFTAPLFTGVLFALAAGLMWGLVFVGPLLLPEYPATLQSFGRYLAFGLIALPLAWFDRDKLRQLARADWLEALKLALVGNIVYYLFLASAIQRAGGPLPTMIIGTLPVVIAITSKLRRAAPGARVEAPLQWRRLAAVAAADRRRASRSSTTSNSTRWNVTRTPTCRATRSVVCWRPAPWCAGPGTRSATPSGCAPTPTAARAAGPRRRA